MEEEMKNLSNYFNTIGKEYRKNLLKYLQWVNEDYENRKEIDYQIALQEIFKERKIHNKYWIILEGIIDLNDWNYREQIITHTNVKDGTHSLKIKISQEEIQKLLKDVTIPDQYIEFVKEIKKPDVEDFIEATEKYDEWVKKANNTQDTQRVVYNNEEYKFKFLGRIAAMLKNNLESPLIPYIFTTKQYKNIVKNSLDFIFKESEKGENEMTPNEYINLLKARNQIILQGPPGTGKTRLAKIIARNIIKGLDEENPIIDDLGNQVKLIQFHPSYSYEDFVRGISAKTTEKGIEYIVENKILAKMAQDALDNKNNKYILIIDEINRANLSSVLGELIYALEYRDEAVDSMYALEKDEDGKSVKIEMQRKITLPSNLYIIGTMNTADRSIGHIDYAIRRRFAFADVLPKESVITDEKAKKLFNQVSEIFDNISPEFDKEKVMLGHSYFIADNDDKLNDKLQYQIKPLLNEYVSDGVLNENAEEKINKLTINKDAVDSDDN